MEYKAEVGDIIFQDSDKTGAKIVKFLMTAPTVWHHIYRAITGTQEKVNYYHPVVVVDMLESPGYPLGTTAEQQKGVQLDKLEDDLKYKHLIVFRRKQNYELHKILLQEIVAKEYGQPWGTVNVFGKLLTWLTGIKAFGRYIKRPNEEVSALRIARWYYKVYGETFGEKDYRDNTTQTMVQYCLNNPDKYEIVYKK